jgi:hypothetical protein
MRVPPLVGFGITRNHPHWWVYPCSPRGALLVPRSSARGAVKPRSLRSALTAVPRALWTSPPQGSHQRVGPPRALGSRARAKRNARARAIAVVDVQRSRQRTRAACTWCTQHQLRETKHVCLVTAGATSCCLSHGWRTRKSPTIIICLSSMRLRLPSRVQQQHQQLSVSHCSRFMCKRQLL